MHHPKSDVNRLYLPRSSGGRGLVQLELFLKTTTIELNAYLTRNDDPLLQIVKYHEQRKKIYSVTKEAAKFCQELGIPEISKDETEGITAYAKRVKKMAKDHGQEKLQESWEEKMMHGKYLKRYFKSTNHIQSCSLDPPITTLFSITIATVHRLLTWGFLQNREFFPLNNF